MPDRRAIFESFAAAWNANDWKALEALHDRETEIVAPEGWPEAGTFRGWPEVSRQYRRVKGSWTSERMEPGLMEPAGEAMLTCTRWITRGESSGAELEVDMWAVTEFRDERIRRIEYFLDEGAARAAAEHEATP